MRKGYIDQLCLWRERINDVEGRKTEVLRAV